eukprot:gb/GEZN01020072.1/.p1 GENE.gb/GEZN01020072.1/~~gb/GEZN01020072.1/.p1  ORF type:complete len:151 (+),score=16.82 gb/GEZN01020072.1/:49-501(+)
MFRMASNQAGRFTSLQAATRTFSSRQCINAGGPAVGAYSSAVKCTGPTVYVSGQLGRVEKNGAMVLADTVEEQTHEALRSMEGILKASGCGMKDVVKCTVLLAEISDGPKVNGVYAKWFNKDPPARAMFAVKALPLGAAVEIDAFAVCPK